MGREGDVEPDLGLHADPSTIYPCALGKAINSEPQLRNENATYSTELFQRVNP